MSLPKKIQIVNKTDLWDELSEYQKICVKEAQNEYKKGRVKSHKEVMKKYSKYL